MKILKKTGIFFMLLLLIGTINSCKKDDKENQSDQQITEDDAKIAIQTDKLTDDLINIIDVNAFEQTANRFNSNLPSCVTQTMVQTGASIEITLEFDANGCTMPNGDTYRGTVTINRSFDATNQIYSGSVAFDNFYVNGIHVEGSSSFEHHLANSSSHPYTTHVYDFSFTFLNGDIAERSGTKTREWIEGYTTPRYNDNVFLITGNAHILRRNGVEINTNIVTPLRKEATCHYFVSGVMEITKNGHTATLDFGNGTCDDEATLTLANGQTILIHL